MNTDPKTLLETLLKQLGFEATVTATTTDYGISGEYVTRLVSGQ